MNMREKIAVAISGAPFPSKASLRKADAVLDALMEPDDRMIEVARFMEDQPIQLAYEAMIRAAREGK